LQQDFFCFLGIENLIPHIQAFQELEAFTPISLKKLLTCRANEVFVRFWWTIEMLKENVSELA
jgi:hypothetical protein